MTRDHSEVQKGTDICDRICGVAKARMRSRVAAGNDLLNAIDIKEGMGYVGGIKNTKVAVAEITAGEGPYFSMLRDLPYFKICCRSFG